jgi:hypothetical protein
MSEYHNSGRNFLRHQDELHAKDSAEPRATEEEWRELEEAGKTINERRQITVAELKRRAFELYGTN